MITKFLTSVTTKFNPFSPRAKTCRIFLAQMPPNSRQTMKITTKLLPRTSTDPSELKVTFSECLHYTYKALYTDPSELQDQYFENNPSDGKEIAFDTEKLKIIDVMEEVDRHSRGLQRKADLTGN